MGTTTARLNAEKHKHINKRKYLTKNESIIFFFFCGGIKFKRGSGGGTLLDGKREMRLGNAVRNCYDMATLHTGIPSVQDRYTRRQRYTGTVEK